MCSRTHWTACFHTLLSPNGAILPLAPPSMPPPSLTSPSFPRPPILTEPTSHHCTSLPSPFDKSPTYCTLLVPPGPASVGQFVDDCLSYFRTSHAVAVFLVHLDVLHELTPSEARRAPRSIRWAATAPNRIEPDIPPTLDQFCIDSLWVLLDSPFILRRSLLALRVLPCRAGSARRDLNDHGWLRSTHEFLRQESESSQRRADSQHGEQSRQDASTAAAEANERATDPEHVHTGCRL
jgi:hypothetical protein